MGVKTIFVTLDRDTYVRFKDALPPDVRFCNPDEWKFNHVWMRDAFGNVVVFTYEQAEERTQ